MSAVFTSPSMPDCHFFSFDESSDDLLSDELLMLQPLTQEPLSMPFSKSELSEGSNSQVCDFSAFIHTEEYPMAQPDDILSGILDSGSSPAELARAKSDAQDSTASVSNDLVDEGRCCDSASLNVDAIPGRSSDLPCLTKDQESADPNQSTNDMGLDQVDSTASVDQTEDEGHIHAVKTLAACPSDNSTGKLPVDARKVSTLEQGISAPDSLVVDDEATKVARHDSVDADKAPPIQHDSEPSSASPLASGFLIPCATDYQAGCKLGTKSAVESSDITTNENTLAIDDGGDDSSDSCASSPSGRASSKAQASGNGTCSFVAVLVDGSPRPKKRKQPMFKSPLPLMEASLSLLTDHTAAKASGACNNDLILISDSDDELQVSTGAYPSYRPKRRRTRKPNYVMYTDGEISSQFEALEEEFLHLERQLQAYKVKHKGFTEYIRTLGFID